MMRYITTVTDVSAGHKIRYSDEHLYALGEYLYSLKPPANPNPENPEGQKVFEREGCGVPYRRRFTPTTAYPGRRDRNRPEIHDGHPKSHGLLQGAVAKRSLVSGNVGT